MTFDNLVFNNSNIDTRGGLILPAILRIHHNLWRYNPLCRIPITILVLYNSITNYNIFRLPNIFICFNFLLNAWTKFVCAKTV